MRNSSRQRGQGATEYILILALAVILILALLFVFRSSISGTTEKISAVVSGKSTEKAPIAAAAGASAPGERSSPPDGAAEKGSSAEKGGPGHAQETSPDSNRSAVDGDSEEERDGGAQAIRQEDGGSSNQQRGMSFKGRGARGVVMWVLIAIAGALVLVVGYFLSAASR